MKPNKPLTHEQIELIIKKSFQKRNNPKTTNNMKIDAITTQYPDQAFLTADGFDQAIIGLDETSMRIIYSITKCITILSKDMPQEDALEHFYFNVAGSYLGDKTPIWCNDLNL